MSERSHARLQVISEVLPGRKWRWLRWMTQALAIVAIGLAPLLGGWQRIDKNHLGAWDGEGWDLPPFLFQHLPLGDVPMRAYESNRLLGGGVAVDYLGIPTIDPLAGLVVLSSAEVSLLLLVAWLIPVLIGAVFGRVFCGWFCPYGVLARSLESLLRRLPVRPPRYQLPARRWLRYLILAAVMIASGLGFQMALYVLLPHLVLQQSLYSLWLMGGGGVVTGWLLGLIAVGMWFGPTSYCAMLCPTGTALGLIGRRRLARVTIAEPAGCGPHCALCTNACWLGLDPASGDPGPDCDSCARCFSICPKTNLRVGLVIGKAKLLPAIVALLLVPGIARADVSDREKPRLLMDDKRVLEGGVEVSTSVVDLTEVRLDADDQRSEGRIEVSIVIFRGSPPAPNELGRQPLREVYTGPLEIQIERSHASSLQLRWDAPTEPFSTPRRSVYRRRISERLAAGDEIIIPPLSGWTDAPLRLALPEKNPGRRLGGLLFGLLHGLLLFGGLLAIALAGGRTDKGGGPSDNTVVHDPT